MSQPFSRRSNALSKLSLLTIFLLIVGSFAIGATLVRSGYHTGVDEMIEQPIPFSHQHHVQGLGLDCRFCHTTVERSASAGFPDTQTCMTCHSQIWKSSAILKSVRDSLATGKQLQWFQINRLPDYVYFNHSAHVNHGVGCVTCHGQVSEMANLKQVRSFFMKDCLSCHTSPAEYLRPRDQVFNEKFKVDHSSAAQLKLMQQNQVRAQEITDCSRCHR